MKQKPLKLSKRGVFVCAPKPMKRVKSRRCWKCLARYSGESCTSPHHEARSHPRYSIYLKPEAVA